MNDRLESHRQKLAAIGQAHVLEHFDELPPPSQAQLLEQLEEVDWDEVARLVDSHVRQRPKFELPSHLEPADYFPWEPTPELKPKYEQVAALGRRLLCEGKVAAFTVAGGQGTRLGWPGPKGTFPATPIRGLPLFGCFAEYLRKAQDKYGAPIRWYLMTSAVNDAETRAFFEMEDYFGLDPANVTMFQQGMMPAIDMVTGKVLLDARDHLALSPNGHGGSLKALYTSGALAEMREQGIEQISYTQVDNPLVRVVDPLFIGLHALEGAQMSSKMLPKAAAEEKVGVFCDVDGRVRVIEYSNMPDELMRARDEEGELKYRAGSIAIHVLRVDFVEALNHGGAGGNGDVFALPYNRAEKKVPFFDADTATRIEPESPNAVKLETFVFDALPFCERSIVYETDRVEEFAPIKNADGPGAVDSPGTSKRLQAERAARWLSSRGVTIPRDEAGDVAATIEIRHLTAIEPADLEGAGLPASIRAGDEVLP